MHRRIPLCAHTCDKCTLHRVYQNLHFSSKITVITVVERGEYFIDMKLLIVADVMAIAWLKLNQIYMVNKQRKKRQQS